MRSRELRRKLTRLLARDLEAFLEHNPGAPARAWATRVLERGQLWLTWHHGVVSRQDDQGELLDVSDFKAARSRANTLAAEGGLKGFVSYPHPYRIAPELKPLLREAGYASGEKGLWRGVREDALGLGSWEAYVVPGPHTHVLGHAGLDGWLETGDNVGHDPELWKVVEDPDGGPLELDPERLKNTIAYLLSHTAVPDEQLHRATYAGDLRTNLGSPEAWLDARALQVLEQVVDQLLEEDPPEEGACSSCGSEDLRSIWTALDVIQERERAGNPLEYERELRKAYWYTVRPEDVLDPPGSDGEPPTVEQLEDWLHRDEPLVLESDLPDQPMPEPDRPETSFSDLPEVEAHA